MSQIEKLKQLKSNGFLASTLAEPVSAVPWQACLDNGTKLSLWQSGVLRIRPALASVTAVPKRVLISSGVHGNETAPMEIVDQLVSGILNGRITVKNELLLMIANPVAANQASRFVEDNMNRLFSGAHQVSGSGQTANYEQLRAAELEKFTQRFFEAGDEPKLHYDCHTAIRGSQFKKFIVYPYLKNREWSKTQLGFLERCGIEAALLSNQASTTFSYFTSNTFGADSFTVELGSVKPFGENDMNQFQAFIDGLSRLIEDKEPFNEKPKRLKTFAVIEEIIKRTDQFELHVEPNALNFTEFPKGSILASDKNYQYVTQNDGERFVFPIANVPIGHRAMLVVDQVILD